MGKKAFTAAITVLLTIFFVVCTQVPIMVKANPIPPSNFQFSNITIQSPLNGTNYALPLLVNFTAQANGGFSSSDTSRGFFYVLDGQSLSSQGIRFTEVQYPGIYPNPIDNSYDYSGQIYLNTLANGPHNITIYFGVLLSGNTPNNEQIYSTASWSATTKFYVGNVTPSPTQIPTPSVPEFSLVLADSFSNINVTNTVYYGSNESSYYSIDPFTGGNITQPKNGMLLFDVGTITLTIKNQPFVPYTDADGHTISLYYNVRFKPHYAGIWTEIYNAGPASPYPEASNSGSTVTSYELGSKNFVNPNVILAYWGIFPFFGIPPNGKIDFQVQAMIGYTYSAQTIQAYLPYVFSGEVSGWSNIQTVTAGNYSFSAPSYPRFSLALPPNFTIQFEGQPHNGTIVISIENQPINNPINGEYYYYYYNVRDKGHNVSDQYWNHFYSGPNTAVQLALPIASSSQYTTLTYSADDYQSGYQIDYQVQIIVATDVHVFPNMNFSDGQWEKQIIGQSDWSNTQTVTIAVASSSESPSPTITLSPILTPSESPTQQPTIEPSSTPNSNQGNLTPILITAGLVVVIVAVAGALLLL